MRSASSCSQGNDVLSPLLDVGWLGFALLAGRAAGRPFGRGPAALTGGGRQALATPLLAVGELPARPGRMLIRSWHCCTSAAALVADGAGA